MPNLNAALGCAQIESLESYLKQKRHLAHSYQQLFSGSEFTFVEEPAYARSNYWLNAIICPNKEAREAVLKETNEAGVMTRPIWKLMHRLPMFENALRGDLCHSEFLEARVVNLPSTQVKNS
jgi:dTDP-4-amino-4,6-dideoxygalactose transaminase